MQARYLRGATICWTSRGMALWLRDPRIAAVVADALEQGESDYRLYQRFAWVIMPNHVHVVMRPLRPLPAVMRWIKGSTAHSANLLLKRTGQPFWLGLATKIEDWPWSS